MTLLIELCTSIVIGVRKKDLIVVIITNVLTNPMLVFIANICQTFLSIQVYWIILILMEVLVVFIEGYIYKKTIERKGINGYILSFINNLASFLIGFIISYSIYR